MDDQVVLDILVQLAGLEDELACVRVVRQKKISRKKSLQELAEEYRQDESKAKDEQLASELNFRDSEGRLEILEAALSDRQDKLVGLTDPRQCKALQDEIVSLKRQIDRLADEALDLLDAGEGKARQVVEATAGKKAQKETLNEEARAQEGQLEQGQAAETEICHEIDRLINMLPPAESRHVQRLRTKLAQSCIWINGSACGACFEQLPQQKALEVQKGKNVVRCPGCARFIVHRPWQ